MKTLVIREVAKDRGNTDRYLVNGSIIVTAASMFSIAVLLAFVHVMDYSPSTAEIVALISLGLLPYALSAICEAIFQAWERMHYIVYASLPVNIIKLLLIYFLLTNGFGLKQVVISIMISHVILVAIEWAMLSVYIKKPSVRMSRQFITAAFMATLTFLGIEVMIAVLSSTNIVLLSKFTSETEVGLYNAAFQILTPLTLLLQSIVFSVFPIMCNRFHVDVEGLRQISEHLVIALFSAALPLSIGLYFLADVAMAMLYANKGFLHGSELLRLIAWSLIPTALTSALGCVLMAIRRERVTFYLVAVHALGNFVVGMALISQLGALGAVITVLIDKTIGFLDHYAFVSRFLHRLTIWTNLWKPLVAGILMAGYLELMQGQNLAVTILGAGGIYAAVLLSLVIWSLGGPTQVRAMYLQLRSVSATAESAEQSIPR